MMIAAFLLLQALDRTAVGSWGDWATFADRTPPRCYAITAPRTTAGFDRRGGFASVSFRRGGRVGAVFLRFTRPRLAAAPVTLSIAGRRFALTGDARAAWSPTPAVDRAIVGAMRGGGEMRVSTLAVSGRPFTERYLLDGAATAVDAASLACLAR